MNVVNHTPFPAQNFEAVDQHGQRFHVFVLRQTLDLRRRDADGAPAYATAQAPLSAAGALFTDAVGGVRQESDYCPFKPACDVIVNASAHAPAGVAVQAFLVRLRVRRAGAPGDILIDKSLRIHGERHFHRRAQAWRIWQALLTVASLGYVRPSPWRLDAAQPFTTLPLRDAYAWGGENRLDAGDPAAARVPVAERLTPAELAAHPDATAILDKRPVAHAACSANPAGAGWLRPWYLRATGLCRVMAPRIEKADAPLTARQFCGQLRRMAGPLPEPAGIGVRALGHPARSRLTGTIDRPFIEGDAAVPADFDFAVWNCGQPDQQIDFLHGDEVFELFNLCRANVPGAHADNQGNTVLRLVLPAHECLLLLTLGDGARAEQPMVVDTVLIEPEDHRLTLVWRAILPIEVDASISTCAIGMQTFVQRDARLRAAAMRDQEARRRAVGAVAAGRP